MAWGQYSVAVVQTAQDVSLNAWEYQLWDGSFHFGTLLVQGMPGAGTISQYGTGMLIFRPHPDQTDDNGWGSSGYLTPFLSSGQPGGGVIGSVVPDPNGNGIDVTASGLVNANTVGSSTYGSFSLSTTFSYDPAAQKVTGVGTLAVSLSGTLTSAPGGPADLNLIRITSNYLSNVPLQGGGRGNTGDMSQASVRYGSTGSDPNNIDWLPAALPSTYPSYASSVLCTSVIGAVNNVDGVALGKSALAIATKPPLNVSLTATNGASLLSFGGQYTTSASQDPYADNVGIVQQVLHGNTSATSLQFNMDIESDAPTTWTGSSGGNWSASGNWQGSSLPQSGVLLRFGPGGGLSNNNLAAGRPFNGIIFPSNASAYVLAGNSIQLGGTVINQSVNPQTIGLPLQLVTGGGTFDTWPAGLTVSGPISGSGPLVKVGSGTLTLAGSNSYTGGTSVSAGLLVINRSGALPTGSILTIGATGSVELGDSTLNGTTIPLGGSASAGTLAPQGAATGGIHAVPEPGTLALLAAAACGLAMRKKGRREGCRCPTTT
jgi:autotransporter-associated beta strand protein